jgi:hypothetical protein
MCQEILCKILYKKLLLTCSNDYFIVKINNLYDYTASCRIEHNKIFWKTFYCVIEIGPYRIFVEHFMADLLKKLRLYHFAKPRYMQYNKALQSN